MSDNKKADLQNSLTQLGVDVTKWPFAARGNGGREERSQVAFTESVNKDTGTKVFESMVKVLSNPTEKTATTPAPSAAQILEAAKYHDYDSMVHDWFTAHTLTPAQVNRTVAVREGALAFAKVILANVPDGTDRDSALTQLRQVMMLANSAISLE